MIGWFHLWADNTINFVLRDMRNGSFKISHQAKYKAYIYFYKKMHLIYKKGIQQLPVQVNSKPVKEEVILDSWAKRILFRPKFWWKVIWSWPENTESSFWRVEGIDIYSWEGRFEGLQDSKSGDWPVMSHLWRQSAFSWKSGLSTKEESHGVES